MNFDKTLALSLLEDRYLHKIHKVMSHITVSAKEKTIRVKKITDRYNDTVNLINKISKYKSSLQQEYLRNIGFSPSTLYFIINKQRFIKLKHKNYGR
jgi:hypothetical protein